MLGTRSVVERLTQLLVILGENHGRRDGNRLVIERKLTHDQIATIVGSTRQWVTMTLDKFQKKGIIIGGAAVDRHRALRPADGAHQRRLTAVR